jgi:hypothetical protein
MSNIDWRKDIANAPTDRRVLMIAKPSVPNTVSMPEVMVAHWYRALECWVAADLSGETHRIESALGQK